MARFAVVVSDSDSDGDGDCRARDVTSNASDASDASDVEFDDASNNDCVLVEAVELGIRNAQLGRAHALAADEALSKLQSLSSVLFHQALSPRWSPRFVAVLKRARMARVRVLLGDEHKRVLRPGAGCHMCGAAEHVCQTALELIGGETCGLESCTMATLPDVADRQDDLDGSLGASHTAEGFLGTYAGGERCFDLAMAAVVARNLLSDTCCDVHDELNRRMTPAVSEQLEADERDPTRAIFALTPIGAIAERLRRRVAAVEHVLRVATLRRFSSHRAQRMACYSYCLGGRGGHVYRSSTFGAA